MYWYYKVIILAVACFLLYGIFALIRPHLPEVNLFSPKPEVVESEKSQNENKEETKSNVDKTAATLDRSVVKKDLTPSQSAILLEAKALYKDKQLLDAAYEKAMTLMESKKLTKFSTGWYRVADFISEINTKLLFSSAPSDRKEVHKVERGDNLSDIATGKTTITALQKGNNIPVTSKIIHPGDYLRYFPGEWSIEISKSHYILILYHKERFFKYYQVGIGKENRTPEGKFLIYGKVIDPIWERKGFEPIRPGDPRNVLGSRWMALKPIGDTKVVGSGYGIHGTTQPDSVGTPASQGCIRMINDQIEELFDIIPDTKVVVTIRK